ncbi:hypothetical protein PanWU01x14_328850 [Parasponia andersonii]|uniref:Retrovirus-related Pol polyprotein from transposon TNT 1-94-like beta-barrel domain-containing protein n=1 Tax=Parasponia andersonii TaxID=3476 RepID=A0A2P5AIM8_PARAD|nr:hypothetical protein PanWU01x14_328850 [Parasponia andersonii]
MTGNPSLFHTFTPCFINFMVKIAGGSLTKVAGVGSVILSEDLILKSVLLVPSLDCNLLSVSKLTRDLTCVTNFFTMHCEFRDLESERMIDFSIKIELFDMFLSLRIVVLKDQIV